MVKETTISVKKYLLVSGGLFCVLLAALGVFLPGLPTTPFLLLAAACFARSSPRLHNKLLNNRFFGELIRNWEKNRTVPRRAKLVGLLTLFLGGCYSLLSISSLPIKIVVLLLLLVPAVILLRLAESPGS